MTAVSADVTKLAKRENISSMDGSWFFDENFSGVSEDFFDGFIKAVDLPMEDIDENAEEEDWNTKFQFLEPHLDLVGVPVGFCGRTRNDDTELKKNLLTTSCEGISQLTQFPSVAAKTTCGRSILIGDDCADNKHMHLIPTSSAVSFPESVGSCSAQFDPKFNKPTKKIRSKRSRSKRSGPATFNPGFPFPCTSSNSSASVNLYRLDASESDLQAFLTEEMLNPAKRKQKKKRNLSQLSSGEMRKFSLEEPGESRETKRCMHCAVTKTPQWREGPLGPKTLCNACGVRYRSGRLFPEYRPAASPTFVASVHSNSHKKVVELRNKACQGATMGIFSSAQ